VIINASLNSRTFNQARLQTRLILITMESVSLLTLINMQLHLCQEIKLVELMKSKSILNSSMMEFTLSSEALRVIKCTYLYKAQTTQVFQRQATLTNNSNNINSGHKKPVLLIIRKSWNKATLEIFNRIRWVMKPNITKWLRIPGNILKLIASNKICQCP